MVLSDLLKDMMLFMVKADVVVTDGFSGNIFLKASEGAAKACLSQLKSAISSNIITKLCGLILRPYLHKKLEFLDPRVNNGAMFIGINGIVVKSHGGSDEIAFENALSVAINLAKNDVNRKIIEEMKKFTEQEENEFSASDIFRKKLRIHQLKFLELEKIRLTLVREYKHHYRLTMYRSQSNIEPVELLELFEIHQLENLYL